MMLKMFDLLVSMSLLVGGFFVASATIIPIEVVVAFVLCASTLYYNNVLVEGDERKAPRMLYNLKRMLLQMVFRMCQGIDIALRSVGVLRSGGGGLAYCWAIKGNRLL